MVEDDDSAVAGVVEETPRLSIHLYFILFRRFFFFFALFVTLACLLREGQQSSTEGRAQLGPQRVERTQRPARQDHGVRLFIIVPRCGVTAWGQGNGGT